MNWLQGAFSFFSGSDYPDAGVCALKASIELKGGERICDELNINAMIAGDCQAFQLLVERYRQELYGYVYAVLHHPKDAEDVLQDVFVQIYLALPDYRGQGLKTWLARIAINKAIDYKRKAQRKREVLIGGYSGAKDYEEQGSWTASESTEAFVLRAEQEEQIRQLIDALPGGHKKTVQAFYLEEKSYKEIAAQEQVELKTVESRVYRAKQWMRKHWKKEEW